RRCRAEYLVAYRQNQQYQGQLDNQPADDGHGQRLLHGRTLDEARTLLADRFDGAELDRQARHRVFPGNRPTTTLVYPKLTPFVLGQIIALYEHRVFVEGVLLGINSYDQWGVELGKELARALEPVLTGKASDQDKDASTRTLIAFLRRQAD
ncbi:hypothetical protein LCGC14_1874610, partial [marine sediment metagenome]